MTDHQTPQNQKSTSDPKALPPQQTTPDFATPGPSHIEEILGDPRPAAPPNLLFLQRTMGNQAVLRMMGLSEAQELDAGESFVQPKLVVNPPNDRYEQEADRIAEQVVSKPSAGVSSSIRRKENKDASIEAVTRVQRQSAGGFAVNRNIERRLATKSGGCTLPKETRAEMEPHLGMNLGHVRIHTDHEAVQLSRDLQAEAFTHGRNVYFGAGKYNPGSTAGKRLLAHELTHVAQQTGGDSLQRKPEREDANGLFEAASTGPASPIPYRKEMEQAFNQDFSKVQGYFGKQQEMEGMQARAATKDEKIAFASPSPSKQLVAHELTHVVQNRQADAGSPLQTKSTVSRPGDSAEREADTVAEQAAAGKRVEVRARPTASIQRDFDSMVMGAGYGDLESEQQNLVELQSKIAREDYDWAIRYLKRALKVDILGALVGLGPFIAGGMLIYYGVKNSKNEGKIQEYEQRIGQIQNTLKEELERLKGEYENIEGKQPVKVKKGSGEDPLKKVVEKDDLEIEDPIKVESSRDQVKSKKKKSESVKELVEDVVKDDEVHVDQIELQERPKKKSGAKVGVEDEIVEDDFLNKGSKVDEEQESNPVVIHVEEQRKKKRKKRKKQKKEIVGEDVVPSGNQLSDEDQEELKRIEGEIRQAVTQAQTEFAAVKSELQKQRVWYVKSGWARPNPSSPTKLFDNKAGTAKSSRQAKAVVEASVEDRAVRLAAILTQKKTRSRNALSVYFGLSRSNDRGFGAVMQWLGGEDPARLSKEYQDLTGETLNTGIEETFGKDTLRTAYLLQLLNDGKPSKFARVALRLGLLGKTLLNTGESDDTLALAQSLLDGQDLEAIAGKAGPNLEMGETPEDKNFIKAIHQALAGNWGARGRHWFGRQKYRGLRHQLRALGELKQSRELKISDAVLDHILLAPPPVPKQDKQDKQTDESDPVVSESTSEEVDPLAKKKEEPKSLSVEVSLPVTKDEENPSKKESSEKQDEVIESVRRGSEHRKKRKSGKRRKRAKSQPLPVISEEVRSEEVESPPKQGVSLKLDSLKGDEDLPKDDVESSVEVSKSKPKEQEVPKVDKEDNSSENQPLVEPKDKESKPSGVVYNQAEKPEAVDLATAAKKLVEIYKDEISEDYALRQIKKWQERHRARKEREAKLLGIDQLSPERQIDIIKSLQDEEMALSESFTDRSHERNKPSIITGNVTYASPEDKYLCEIYWRLEKWHGGIDDQALIDAVVQWSQGAAPEVRAAVVATDSRFHFRRLMDESVNKHLRGITRGVRDYILDMIKPREVPNEGWEDTQAFDQVSALTKRQGRRWGFNKWRQRDNIHEQIKDMLFGSAGLKNPQLALMQKYKPELLDAWDKADEKGKVSLFKQAFEDLSVQLKNAGLTDKQVQDISDQFQFRGAAGDVYHKLVSLAKGRRRFNFAQDVLDAVSQLKPGSPELGFIQKDQNLLETLRVRSLGGGHVFDNDKKRWRDIARLLGLSPNDPLSSTDLKSVKWNETQVGQARDKFKENQNLVRGSVFNEDEVEQLEERTKDIDKKPEYWAARISAEYQKGWFSNDLHHVLENVYLAQKSGQELGGANNIAAKLKEMDKDAYIWMKRGRWYKRIGYTRTNANEKLNKIMGTERPYWGPRKGVGGGDQFKLTINDLLKDSKKGAGIKSRVSMDEINFLVDELSPEEILREWYDLDRIKRLATKKKRLKAELGSKEKMEQAQIQAQIDAIDRKLRVIDIKDELLERLNKVLTPPKALQVKKKIRLKLGEALASQHEVSEEDQRAQTLLKYITSSDDKDFDKKAKAGELEEDLSDLDINLMGMRTKAISHVEYEKQLQTGGTQWDSQSSRMLQRDEASSLLLGKIWSLEKRLKEIDGKQYEKDGDKQRARERSDLVKRLEGAEKELVDAQKRFVETKKKYDSRIQTIVAILISAAIFAVSIASGVGAAAGIIQLCFAIGAALLSTAIKEALDHYMKGDAKEAQETVIRAVAAVAGSATAMFGAELSFALDAAAIDTIHNSSNMAVKLFGKAAVGYAKGRINELFSSMGEKGVEHFATEKNAFSRLAPKVGSGLKSWAEDTVMNAPEKFVVGVLTTGTRLAANEIGKDVIGSSGQGLGQQKSDSVTSTQTSTGDKPTSDNARVGWFSINPNAPGRNDFEKWFNSMGQFDVGPNAKLGRTSYDGSNVEDVFRIFENAKKGFEDPKVVEALIRGLAWEMDEVGVYALEKKAWAAGKGRLFGHNLKTQKPQKFGGRGPGLSGGSYKPIGSDIILKQLVQAYRADMAELGAEDAPKAWGGYSEISAIAKSRGITFRICTLGYNSERDERMYQLIDVEGAGGATHYVYLSSSRDHFGYLTPAGGVGNQVGVDEDAPKKKGDDLQEKLKSKGIGKARRVGSMRVPPTKKKGSSGKKRAKSVSVPSSKKVAPKKQEPKKELEKAKQPSSKPHAKIEGDPKTGDVIPVFDPQTQTFQNFTFTGVKGDGHCLFRAMSSALGEGGSDQEVLVLRGEASDAVKGVPERQIVEQIADLADREDLAGTGPRLRRLIYSTGKQRVIDIAWGSLSDLSGLKGQTGSKDDKGAKKDDAPVVNKQPPVKQDDLPKKMAPKVVQVGEDEQSKKQKLIAALGGMGVKDVDISMDLEVLRKRLLAETAKL